MVNDHKIDEKNFILLIHLYQEIIDNYLVVEVYDIALSKINLDIMKEKEKDNDIHKAKNHQSNIKNKQIIDFYGVILRLKKVLLIL